MELSRTKQVVEFVAPKNGNVIEISNLTKRFGEVVAVDDLSLSVERGSIYGLIGPNAAGKTTVVRHCVGKLQPDTGSVNVLGHTLPDEAQLVLPDIGLMPQGLALYPDLLARQNLEFFGRLQGLDRNRIKQQIKSLSARMQLKEELERVTSHLSGGTKRRLSLACALLHEPKLLLLDEPTVGIDPVLRRKFWDDFRRLRDTDVTILVTTHYLAEAERCDRIGLLRQGKLVAEGPPKTLMKQYGVESLEEVFIKAVEVTLHG